MEQLVVAAIIPCYKCQVHLKQVIGGLQNRVDMIIVVDDGNRPALKLPVAGPHIHLLRLDKNKGVGGAIISGFQEAIRLGADVGVVLAGDGQMDPEDLGNLLKPLENGVADVVKGDRLSHPESNKIPFIRKFGNYALSYITRILSGYNFLIDSQSGYVAVNLHAIKDLPLNILYPRYGFPNDFLIFISAYNLRLAQVQVRPIYNGARSGLNPFLAMFTYPLILMKAFAFKLGIRIMDVFRWRGRANTYDNQFLPYW